MKYFVAFVGVCGVVWIFFSFGIPSAFVAGLAMLVLWKIWPEPDYTAPRDMWPPASNPKPAAGGRGNPARKPDDRRPANKDLDFPMPIPPARPYEQVGDTTGLFEGIKSMKPLGGEVPTADVRPRRVLDDNPTADDGTSSRK